jgi:glutathione synthase/RimK-type ligase-like ATP-grasp enzyme
MSKILMTMNEETQTTCENHFGVTYKVDEHDCLDCAAALESLGHDVFFVNWNDLDGRQFDRMFHDNDKRFVKPVPLEDMDLIWVYQMEGFYADLPRFLDMVRIFEDACPLVINDPRTIRHNLGKSYLCELQRSGVQVIPTYGVDEAVRRRLGAGGSCVLKPVFGERGNGVILARIPDGEKSLVFLGIRYHHAVIKRPCPGNPDEFRCNESLGGTVSAYEPTAAELAYAERVLIVYESFGCPVHYSRIDFIDTEQGPLLMEAELLNPAAFANYSGKGLQFGQKVAEYLDSLIAPTKVSCLEARNYGARAQSS